MPPFHGGAGSPSNTMSPGPRPASVSNGILNLDPSNRLATTNMGRKLGGARSPSNTVWPEPRPTCVHSFILTGMLILGLKAKFLGLVALALGFSGIGLGLGLECSGLGINNKANSHII